MRSLLLRAGIALALALPVFAQYEPPDGTVGIDQFVSPRMLAGAGNVATMEPPASDVLNPATSGNTQRTTFDLSYITLAGLGSDSGLGSALNLGLTKPTRVGVFSGSANLRAAGFDNVDWGSLASLNFSFAKDLYPNLLVGAGIDAAYGTNGGADWALGLDLGFLHLAGDVGPLHDLRWGVAVRDIGKGFQPDTDKDPYPAPFTPAIGAQATVLRTDGFALGAGTDVSFAGFRDVATTVGLEGAIRDTVFLRASYVFDSAEALGVLPSPSIPLSFGATVKLKTRLKENIDFLDITKRGWNQSEVRINFSATPMPGDVWAFGVGVNIPLGVVDRNPPKISLGAPPEEDISPNQDGVKDDFVTPLSITDERYVLGYRLVIDDPTGRAVRTIVNKDERPENVTVKNILDRLLYVKSGIPIPDTLRWDGLSDQAQLVADGTYSYYVEAWDDNGNTGRSETKKIVVDNTPPTVQVSAPYLIFSPNGDGNKDTLPVEQSGSSEDLWSGSVRGAGGQAVATREWKQGPPAPFDWDGRASGGALAPDGVYSYHVEATDRAGNRGAADLANIIVNTQATPITLSVDGSYFSPNGDGVKDTLELSPGVPVESGVESWTLRVEDGTGAERRSYSGEKQAPGPVSFDGRDASGKPLPEGAYRAVLEVRYVNGNRPVATSPTFTIDLTPPRVSVRADLDVFSPNGDGNKDAVTIYQETSEETGWAGIIRDEHGQVVDRLFWRGRADTPVTWDGRGTDGRLLPDGVYTYVLQTTDRAGNSAESAPVRVRIDTEQTPVILTRDLAVFSPNGDGSRDSVAIVPQLRRATGIESWQIRVLDSSGRVVRSVQRQGEAPSRWDWDGRSDAGVRAGDGEYVAEITVRYANGNTPVARTAPFAIDTVFPQVEVAADPLLFSPDGDGNADVVRITQKSSSEALWEGEVKNAAGDIVRSWFWKGAAGDFAWDGKDENGNTVPDGAYSYVVRSTDAAGNKTEGGIRSIVVDDRPTPIFVTATSSGFSPNGDGVRDTIGFNLYVNLSQGIESWQLALARADGGAVKTFSGKATVPAQLTWDGKSTDDGKPAPEGLYSAKFSVRYLKGNHPEATASQFRLDVSPPRAAISVSPKPFSPDNDGVDDEVKLGLDVDDPSGIQAWALEILDPTGKLFRRYSGTGKPAREIIWNGLSPGGELVQAAEDYPVRLAVSDALGNATTVQSVIPVDILVIRDGDKLKIRISSITFEANTANYLNVEPDKVERNLRTLKRLAEILQKYKSYDVRIEGHAVNLSWADPAAAEREEQQELAPLSLARAEAVKAALVDLGIDPKRLTTAGLGGRFPIVPHGDLENRWKNRRVEFILVRPGQAQ